MKFYMIFYLIFLLKECSISDSRKASIKEKKPSLANDFEKQNGETTLLISVATSEAIIKDNQQRKSSSEVNLKLVTSTNTKSIKLPDSIAVHIDSPCVTGETVSTNTCASSMLSNKRKSNQHRVQHQKNNANVPILPLTTTTTKNTRVSTMSKNKKSIQRPVVHQKNKVTIPILPLTTTTPTTNTSGALPPQKGLAALIPPKRQETKSATTSSRLSEFEALTEELFNKESSNLFKKMTVNYQGRKLSSSLTDEATLHLININEADLESVTTISKLRLLYNNYQLDSIVNEHVNINEKKEENEFVDAIMRTPVMRYAMSFLQQKGKVTLDPKTHRDLIKTVWFSLYARHTGRTGSSSFEHIFLSEITNGTISGLNNWVYFYEQERAGHVNYMGWFKKVKLGKKAAILKYNFTHENKTAPVNTMFIGTSPELELALYTICFQMSPDKECNISLGGKKFSIRTNTIRYQHKNLIESAFLTI